MTINSQLLDLTIENIKLKDENKRLKEQLEYYINNDDCPAEHWFFKEVYK